QPICEPESMDEAEGQGDPDAHVAAAANHQIICANIDNAERNCWFDETWRRMEQAQQCQHERDRIARRKTAGQPCELTPRSSGEEHPEQKKKMVRPETDMAESSGDESPANRRRTFPRASVVVETGFRGIENGLQRQHVAFVNIDERLMGRVVRKHPRVDGIRTWPAVDFVLGSEAH